MTMPEIKTTYKDEIFDLSHFNYDGECGKLFKYKPNNQRDLLIYGVYFSDKQKWFKQKHTTMKALSLNQHGIPNAKKVLMLGGEVPEVNFTSLMKSKGVDVIPVKVDSLYNGAVLRYFVIQKYLEENKEKYDRVFVADLRDVFFFEDGFSTFSDKQLYLSNECSRTNKGDIKCASLALKITKIWMQKSINKEVAELYAANKTKIINSGTIFGGTEHVLRLLQIFTSHFNYQRVNIWGYDQSLLNYLYYSGQFNSLNITVANCDQMFCFDMRNGCYYNKKEKSLIMRGSNCSPIIRHKIVSKNPYFDLS
ncbi:hypothetical protein CL6EHI_012440 [Entamoeba histolytica]|uniref:Uncharacterized protein n=6 Tax=Entamoeba histolytica TaxID=5759 RepID=C4LTN3_ENTH1|nr:hypothetical protein EHI_012440 [Entamoeba histolytica HM-1:IMSS]EAL49964.2 hypothetical protein EHI_012440 [Entamoeba histolytica HM-1:IMSS]EMD48352.1 Hypothetical protein EHI5A_134340 [Entamoeba histolytica KU27]ENY63656.1 hypothetical protein EHI7A_122280 [Entamoeba histolytica HM-1:IMSS-A]GAT91931.1 hypothetical protein CL6EHI_012440 [Entamoeba histolytica]|eukprot:XP_655335.2 hypothetical protein EHI_012440 [Entamoeba histolytica HM-1:IMSS]